jgi:hypothetical protein
MIEIDVVACLVRFLRKSHLHERESSAKAIVTLVKFRMLLSYFEPLKG